MKRKIFQINFLLILSLLTGFCSTKKNSNNAAVLALLKSSSSSLEKRDRVVLFHTAYPKKSDGKSDFSKKVISWIERDGDKYTYKENNITVTPTSGINLMEYDNHLFVSNCRFGKKNQELLIYNFKNEQVSKKIIPNQIGECAQDLVVKSQKAYVIMQNQTSIVLVDIRDKKNPTIQNSTISVGSSAKSMPTYIQKYGNELYVVNQDSYPTKVQSTLTKIDLDTNKRFGSPINIGDNPSKITFFTKDKSIWTLNSGFYELTSGAPSYTSLGKVGGSNPRPYNRSASISFVKNGSVKTVHKIKPDMDGDALKENIKGLDFNNQKGYVILKDSNDSRGKLVEINTNDGSFKTSNVTTDKDYINLIQNRKQNLFFKIYKDNAGKSKIDIEDLDGNFIETLDIPSTNGWNNAK